jgi:hypothetical protein
MKGAGNAKGRKAQVARSKGWEKAMKNEKGKMQNARMSQEIVVDLNNQ